MLNETPKTYNALEPFIKRDFLRYSHKQGNQQQYSSIANPNHTHNGIDSPQVSYPTLRGVKNFLVSNTITLTSAQIRALHTTPIVLVANPGKKSFVFVEGVAGRLTFGTTSYTGTNNLEFRYTDGAGLKVCADMPTVAFLNSSSSAYSYSPFVIDQNRNVDSNFTPVGGDIGNNGQIVVSVPTANPATGNSAVTLTIYYRIVSFST